MVYLGLPIKNGGSFHGYVSHNQTHRIHGAGIYANIKGVY